MAGSGRKILATFVCGMAVDHLLKVGTIRLDLFKLEIPSVYEMKVT